MTPLLASALDGTSDVRSSACQLRSRSASASIRSLSVASSRSRALSTTPLTARPSCRSPRETGSWSSSSRRPVPVPDRSTPRWHGRRGAGGFGIRSRSPRTASGTGSRRSIDSVGAPASQGGRRHLSCADEARDQPANKIPGVELPHRRDGERVASRRVLNGPVLVFANSGTAEALGGYLGFRPVGATGIEPVTSAV